MNKNIREQEHAVIRCTCATPFQASNVAQLIDAEGNCLPVAPVMVLCRCGRSRRKPYCDGSHVPAGINGNKSDNRVPDRRIDYHGREITIHDNRGVCSHDRSCVLGLPRVFRKNHRPWIDPDAANPEEIENVVRKCPSGALSTSRHGVPAAEPQRPPAIRVAKNGPLEITGNIGLEDDLGSRPESREHYCLCRCGESRNQPFCDGSHRTTRFRDDAPEE
ncbi:MAG: CDGSH iron-sulfur domain-containing protein [Candidatus Aminicenantes bacterium]|nr:CDGSH iron-sulfur domain-containing protein [Candidatus Aminicenantes bacterium]